MTAIFSRTVRALEEPGRYRRWPGFAAVVVLLSWASWFLLGRVTVYEVTEQGRLEVQSKAHTVAALLPGRVVETHLAIGQEVKAGEVLAVLDAEAERLAVSERQARRESLRARLVALRQEIGAEKEAMAVQREARAAALKTAKSHVATAKAHVTFAARQLEMYSQLHRQGAASAEELRRAQSDADVQRIEVQSSELEVLRMEQDRVLQESERKVRLAKLDRDAADLTGEIAAEEAAIRRQEHDIELRIIRAPVSGLIGEVIEHPVGSVVGAAEKLASIIPPGAARAVAHFPVAAVGRLHPGQPARLRLEGFPWTQYGTVTASVAEVSTEASGGMIRVVLALADDQAMPIRLEHGLPCSAEVEVEQVAPAVLMLRSGGRLLATRRPSASEAPPP